MAGENIQQFAGSNKDLVQGALNDDNTVVLLFVHASKKGFGILFPKSFPPELAEKISNIFTQEMGKEGIMQMTEQELVIQKSLEEANK